MGVRFYTCRSCKDNFPDVRPHFQCFTCSSMFCSDECGDKQIFKESEPEYEELTNCKARAAPWIQLFIFNWTALTHD